MLFLSIWERQMFSVRWMEVQSFSCFGFWFNKSLALPFQSIQNKHALKWRPHNPENVKSISWFHLLGLSATVNLSQSSMLELNPIPRWSLFANHHQYSLLKDFRLWFVSQAWRNIVNANSNMSYSIILSLVLLRLLLESVLIIIEIFRNLNRKALVIIMSRHKQYFSISHYILAFSWEWDSWRIPALIYPRRSSQLFSVNQKHK